MVIKMNDNRCELIQNLDKLHTTELGVDNMFDFSKLEFITDKKVLANLQEIIKVEKELGLTIPDIYKEFLLRMNGAELSDELLYSTDDLVEMNILNEVREYAPGFISIGSDNGDYELLMKATKDEIAFRLVDAGYMVPEDENDTIYPSFKDWINNGAVLIEEEEEEKEEVGKLILIAPPEKSDLVIIEKAFNIQYRAFDILKGYKNVPFILANNIAINDASEKIKLLGDLGKLLRIEKIN